MYAKVAFPRGFLCNSLLKEKQKNYCVLSNFCIVLRYFSKMKRKTMKQKIDKCFPINL